MLFLWLHLYAIHGWNGFLGAKIRAFMMMEPHSCGWWRISLEEDRLPSSPGDPEKEHSWGRIFTRFVKKISPRMCIRRIFWSAGGRAGDSGGALCREREREREYRVWESSSWKDFRRIAFDGIVDCKSRFWKGMAWWDWRAASWMMGERETDS